MTSATRLLRRHGPALVGYLVCALLFTLPVWLDPLHRLPGESTSDLADHAWGYHWVARSLADGRIPFHTDLVRFPAGGSLFFGDPLGALMAAPLVWIVGLVPAFSLVAMFQLVFAAMAAYAVGLRWCGSRPAAFVGGTVFAFSSYALSCLHSGTSGYLVLGFLPLFLFAAGRALTRGGGRWLLAAAVTAWAITFAAPYYGLFAAVFTLVLAGVLALRREVEVDALIGRGAAVAALSAAGMAPTLLAVRAAMGAGDALVSPDNSPGWDQVTLPRIDALTFLVPWDYHFPDMAAEGNIGILHANSLGWIALGLAAVAGWRVIAARRWWAALAVYAVLMLGPQLTVAGRPLALGSLPLYLPYAALCFPGSPLRSIHHPHRMVVWAMLLLGLLAALGLAHLLRGRSPRARWTLGALVAAAVVGESLLLSPAHWPLPVTELDPPARCAELGREAEGAILDFPPGAVHEARTYLLRATVHRRPTAYWVTSYLPEEVLANGLIREALARIHDGTTRRTTRERRLLPGVPTGTATERPSADSLVALGFSHLLVHPGALDPRDREVIRELFSGALGPPRVWEDGTEEYALSAPAVEQR